MNQQSASVISNVPNAFMALKACRHGRFLYNVNDTFVGRSLDLYGEWCEEEIEVLSQIIKPGSVVLDIGANIGTHTICFAKQALPGGVVYAFEPQRLVFQNLCANIALNELVNVIAQQVGVGDTKQRIMVPTFDPRHKANFGAIQMEGHQAGEEVDVIRVDDLNLPKCNVIKIDVEGMESKVLRGAQQTIARFKPVLFIENDTIERSHEVLEQLAALDYVGYWQIAPYFNPRNYFNRAENVFAQYFPQSNILCFHRSSKTTITGMEPIVGTDDNWQKAQRRIAERSRG